MSRTEGRHLCADPRPPAPHLARNRPTHRREVPTCPESHCVRPSPPMIAALVLTATVLAAPPGTNTAAAEAAACAALYSVPTNVGPEPLSACQWDMRAIGATPAGSYAVNRGKGARVGDIDTGIDLTNTRHHAQRRCRRVVRVHLRGHPDLQPGGAGHARVTARTRLRCRISPGTVRTPPGRSPRRSTGSASPASRPKPRSWSSRRAPSRATSSPSPWSTRCGMPAISGLTS